MPTLDLESPKRRGGTASGYVMECHCGAHRYCFGADHVMGVQPGWRVQYVARPSEPLLAGELPTVSGDIPVYCLHQALGLHDVEQPSPGRVMIARTHRGPVGLWVDQVLRVRQREFDRWAAYPPAAQPREGNPFQSVLMRSDWASEPEAWNGRPPISPLLNTDALLGDAVEEATVERATAPIGSAEDRAERGQLLLFRFDEYKTPTTPFTLAFSITQVLEVAGTASQHQRARRSPRRAWVDDVEKRGGHVGRLCGVAGSRKTAGLGHGQDCLRSRRGRPRSSAPG